MKKNKYGILLLVCAMLFATVGCGATTTENEKPEEKEVNTAYTQFLTDNGLEDKDYFETQSSVNRTNTFVNKDEETGMIEITEYVWTYEGVDKLICDDMTIIRYPISGYTDDQKQALDQNMKESFATIEALSFVEVQYTIEAEWYEVAVHAKELDHEGNYWDAAQAGLYTSMPVSRQTKISYDKTIQELTDSGYISKFIEE